MEIPRYTKDGEIEMCRIIASLDIRTIFSILSVGYFHSFMNIPNVVDKWHEAYDKYIFLCFKFYDKLNANEDAYRVRLMRTR